MSGIINALLASFAKGFLKVGSVTVNNSGQYSGTPDVVFTGGGGTGATAIAIMGTISGPGSLVAISGSAGYYSVDSSVPFVNISGGGGSGATATANFGTGMLVTLGYGGEGGARTTQQQGSLTITGGGGTGAAVNYSGGTARYTFIYPNITITNGGSGYTSPPTVVWSLPDSGVTVNAYPTTEVTISGGQVTSIVMTSPGDVISNPNNDLFIGVPSFTLSGGGGSGATFNRGNASISPIDYWVVGGIGSINIINRGTGYTSSPTITAPGQITGTIQGYIGREVDSITITNGGSGYTDEPNVTLSGGTPYFPNAAISSNFFAQISATSYNIVNFVSITNQGTGYTSTPIVSFSGGGPIVNATATANMVPG